MLLNSSASKILSKIVIIKPDISPFGLLTIFFFGSLGVSVAYHVDQHFLLPSAQI